MDRMSVAPSDCWQAVRTEIIRVVGEMKHGITLFLVNDRWRGVMPFRNEKLRNHLKLQKRTGEPFPVWFYPEGYGKANGSFTEKVRLSLIDWMKDNYGSWSSPIIFGYKLHRHKTVTIAGTFPYIKHLPIWGKGMRGFVLELNILSIDGIPFKGFLGKRQNLAWNRILEKEKLPPLLGLGGKMNYLRQFRQPTPNISASDYWSG